MSIFNKTVSAGNLFNGAIDQYSRRIPIGSQHFQRTLPTFFSFFIPEVFGENRHQIKSSDSSSIDVHAAAPLARISSNDLRTPPAIGLRAQLLYDL